MLPYSVRLVGLNISLHFLPEWKGKVLKILLFSGRCFECKEPQKIFLSKKYINKFNCQCFPKRNRKKNKDFLLTFGLNSLNYEKMTSWNIQPRNSCVLCEKTSNFAIWVREELFFWKGKVLTFCDKYSLLQLGARS